MRLFCTPVAGNFSQDTFKFETFETYLFKIHFNNYCEYCFFINCGTNSKAA